MDPGEWSIRWTVRLALGLYALALAARLLAKPHRAWLGPARWAWSLGCALPASRAAGWGERRSPPEHAPARRSLFERRASAAASL